jgi:hypothetical protein
MLGLYEIAAVMQKAKQQQFQNFHFTYYSLLATSKPSEVASKTRRGSLASPMVYTSGKTDSVFDLKIANFDRGK